MKCLAKVFLVDGLLMVCQVQQVYDMLLMCENEAFY